MSYHPTIRRVAKTVVRGKAVTHSRGFEVLARAGFVARAAIYAIIGILAVELAIGVGGRTTNQKGALQLIAAQPFGQVLLTRCRDRIGRLLAVAAQSCAVGSRARVERQHVRSRGGAGERHRLRRDLRARG